MRLTLNAMAAYLTALALALAEPDSRAQEMPADMSYARK